VRLRIASRRGRVAFDSTRNYLADHDVTLVGEEGGCESRRTGARVNPPQGAQSSPPLQAYGISNGEPRNFRLRISEVWSSQLTPSRILLQTWGLQSGRPIIGIAQSGSDLVPCNRIHTTLVERVKGGIRDAGGVPFEFPTHPIQETGSPFR